MKFITQAQNIQEIDELIKANVDQVIISPKELSRKGNLSLTEAQKLIAYTKNKNIRVYLQCDAICTEGNIHGYKVLLSQIHLEAIDAFRVQDLGIAYYIVKELKKNVHVILENGFRNLKSVQSILKIFQKNCLRVILSGEVPFTKLHEWLTVIPCETEILFIGRPLLFYSPRNLIEWTGEGSHTTNCIRINSEKFGIKDKVIVYDNVHGTLIYYSKDLLLLPFYHDLEKSGVSSLRFDRDEDMEFMLLLNIIKGIKENKIKKILDEWPREYFFGFFKENKTTERFAKLKNYLREGRDENFLARVIEAYKDKPIVMQAMRKINGGDKVYFITPLGKKINFDINDMEKPFKGKIDSVSKGSIFTIPKRKGVTSQSYLFLESAGRIPIS